MRRWSTTYTGLQKAENTIVLGGGGVWQSCTGMVLPCAPEGAQNPQGRVYPMYPWEAVQRILQLRIEAA